VIETREPIAFIPGMRVRVRVVGRGAGDRTIFTVVLRATIEKVHRDRDGRDCAAVTFDDDPCADLHRRFGKYHYFYREELEPIGEGR